ncbi:MAG TPA: sulfite exporter TauE/SafE family protein [Methylotenera sp.]|nr:sulfite exporter TauE/SafE family protein [Methylotenera sp.]HPH05344.1 sulfite exporter TauE/SafE family protein [Methylotenera sp.]HPN01270.1 sulfite exporter TauE/SafE family protein [Methylotenera sp.]
MQSPLLLTAFFMGLAGGPHCIAMCGAACASLQQGQIQNQAQGWQMWKFHAGRLLGYAALGAIAAASVKSLAWFTEQTTALHPLWTFFHVLIFAWGLILLIYARQPVWAEGIGRKIWAKVRQLSSLPGGIFVTGVLWALLPCGLLYSALLVASLNANPINGGLTMAAFAFGTSISLMIGPWLWLKLKSGKLIARSKWFTEDASMRLAGLLLAGAAGWAIWMDLMHQTKVWCV